MQFMRLPENAIASPINWDQLIENFPPHILQKDKAFVFHRILSPRSHCQRRRWLLLLLSIFLIAAQRTKQRAAARQNKKKANAQKLWVVVCELFQVISISPCSVWRSEKLYWTALCPNARNMVWNDDLCSPNSVATCHIWGGLPLWEFLFDNYDSLRVPEKANFDQWNLHLHRFVWLFFCPPKGKLWWESHSNADRPSLSRF